MVRYLLFILFALSLSCNASASSNQDDEYKFQLCDASFVLEDFKQQSLTELLQEAKSRKLHIEQLFTIVKQYGLNEKTLKIFESGYNYHLSKGAIHLTPQTFSLFFLKNDISDEHTLLCFYEKSLQQIMEKQQSTDKIQLLYEHTVHLVRSNLESLFQDSFNIMKAFYPNDFSVISGSYKRTKDFFIKNKDFGQENSEKRIASECIQRFGKDDRFSLDTTKVIEMADFYNQRRQYLKSYVAIFSLNTIHFYLNIERALLAMCPELKFDYSVLDNAKRQPDKKFVMSAILGSKNDNDFLNQALFGHHIGDTARESIRKCSNNSKFQNSMINSVLSLKSTKVDQILYGIFPDLNPTKKIIDKKAEPYSNKKKVKSKNKGNSKKDNNTKNKKQPKKNNKSTRKAIVLKDDESEEDVADNIENIIDRKSIISISTNTIEHTVNDFIQSHETTASKATIVLSTASSSVEPIDHIVAVFTNDNDAIPTASNGQTSFSYKDVLLSSSPEQEAIISASSSNSVSEINFASYQTATSYDDYVYKRDVSSRANASYKFGNVEYGFPTLKPFDTNFLAEIKHATKLAEDSLKLPNLASYVLRIHYIVRSSNEPTSTEFASEKLYLSGGKTFHNAKIEFKEKRNIINAYHDFLTTEQIQQIKRANDKDKYYSLSKIMEEKLNQKIAIGAWRNNCADSEALLLLDLVDSMPNYVSQITKNWTTSVEVKGLALGIHSYRDCCWRCRNLIQGFQWSTNDLLHQITLNSPAKDALTIAKDYGSVVLVSGQIQPKSSANDFLPPVKVEGTLILGTANSNDKSKHKFVEVSRKN